MMHSLDPGQVAHLTVLRRELHSHPKIPGEEGATTRRVIKELTAIGADRIWSNLGGHGVAAEFKALAPGPTVHLRSELDGLPIRERSALPCESRIEGKEHFCGHDGQMASMLAEAMRLAARPASGRVISIFQPTEENGAGSKAVIADGKWPDIQPDYTFADNNVPECPLGGIGLRPGPGNCAFRGVKVHFEGKSPHAAAPEDGVPPTSAMAGLMSALPRLSHGTVGEDDFALSTVTHASLGQPNFGIAPADGELRVTLRTMRNDRMESLIAEASAQIECIGGHLKLEVFWHDAFRSVLTDPDATAMARDVAQALGFVVSQMDLPMRWPEDIGQRADDGVKATMLYSGSGETQPQVHHPDYDFPDALLPVVVHQFGGIVALLPGSSKP